MAKEVKAKVVVDSSQVDAAAQKVTELKAVSEGSPIKIQYENGKALDVVFDKTVNLKQQVRLLSSELQKLSLAGKENSQEFKVVSAAYNNAKDNLDRVNAKSKDLFASLALIPGPIGDIAGKLNGAIGLMKTFSGFSLKDFKNQFKELGNDLKDIVNNLTGFNDAQKDLKDNIDDSGSSIEKNSKTLNTAAGATIANTQATRGLTQAQKDAAVDGKIYDATLSKGTGSIQNMTSAMNVANQTTRINGDVAKGAAVGNGLLARALNAVGASALAASAGVAILDAALMAIGIGVLIAGLVAVGSILIDVAKKMLGFEESTKESEAAVKAFNEAIKEQQRLLEGDLSAIDTGTKLAKLRAEIAGKSEAEIYKIVKKGGEDRLQALRDNDEQLYQEQRKLANRQGRFAKMTTEERSKINDDLNERLQKSGDDIIKQILSNEETALTEQKRIADKRRGASKDSNAKRISDLEAQIQLEIDKEKTSQKELERLFKEKTKLQLAQEKLTAAQLAVLRAENRKKIEDAIKEDAVREATIVMDAQQRRVTELETAFGKDEKYFQARRDLANATFQKEFADAGNNENEQKNARTKYYAEIHQIDLQALDEGVALKKMYLDVEREDTAAFFQAQRNLEEAEYQRKKKEAEQNAEKLELIEREHKKKLGEIDQRETLSNLEKELAIIQTRNESIQEGLSILTGWRKAQLEEINKNEQIELQKAEDNEKLKTEIKKKYAAQRNAINKEELDSYLQSASLVLGAASQFSNDLSEINNLQQELDIQNAKKSIKDEEQFKKEEDKIKEKYFYKNQKTQVAQATIGYLQAAIQAYQSLAVIPVVGPALGAAAAAAAIIFGMKKVSLIKQQTYQSSTEDSGGAPGQSSTWRGMAEGGYIEGPRHAAGGVMINAEGGEAVMTRGAVTMFGPMLSMLNQMGGGTSFSKGAVGGARPDNPIVKNVPLQQNSAQVIKTYVVEAELTSAQQKQARLKDLSTL
jgi:hypothetical protein